MAILSAAATPFFMWLALLSVVLAVLLIRASSVDKVVVTGASDTDERFYSYTL